MRMPRMPYSDGIRKTTQMHFRGLDHNLGAQDGALWDMSNLCSNHYPLLSTRPHRHLYKLLNQPGGIYAWNKMCWVDGDKFLYDGVVKGTVSKGAKTFGNLGAKIIILPDKMYYDVKNDTFASLESTWTGTAVNIQDGTYNGVAAKANTLQAVGTNWEDYFKPGDAVALTGCTRHPKNNKTIIIREISGDKLVCAENTFEMEEGGAGYQETGSLTLKRSMPDLIAICENGNRLWGCTKDTIHASALGDPTNWERFDGVETDSWAVTPSSSGWFIGCTTFHGSPVFFKEDCLTKIFGSLPSSFQTQDTASLGIQETSGMSLASAGENLYYMGRTGMMVYNGGIPRPISKAFGGENYRSAVAGSDGLKYYVSAQGQDGRHRILVYDSQRRSWHKEDYRNVTHFTVMDGTLYGITADGELWAFGDGKELPPGLTREGDFPWYAEFTDFTDSEANRKGLTKLQIRLDLESEGFCRILISYDSGPFEVAKCIDGTGDKRSYNIPITPRRCDHYRLRLEGQGDCQIYSISRDVCKGSSLG